MKSKFVDIVTVTDPDTKAPVEVEIRKLENGAMVGIDGAAIDEYLTSPYDVGEPIEIPDDEEGDAMNQSTANTTKRYFVANVYETVVLRKEYFVTADSLDEAREKMLNGETEKEITISTLDVIYREISEDVCELTKGE